jgi:hypothetical protein
MAEHHREQPDDPQASRLVGEGREEAGEVDLRLIAGRGLERTSNGFGWLSGRIAATKRFTAV